MSDTSTISRAAPRQPAYKRSGPPAQPATATYYRVVDLAARLRCSNMTIYRVLERVGVKTGRIGKTLLIRAEDVAQIDAAVMRGSLADLQSDNSETSAA